MKQTGWIVLGFVGLLTLIVVVTYFTTSNTEIRLRNKCEAQKQVIEGFYDVTAPKDFFKMKKEIFDAIIMNPPFSGSTANLKHAPPIIKESGMKVGYHILEECMKMSDIIIALMPWFTLSDSDNRLKRLMAFGMKSITSLPRSTFNYTRIQTLILHLEKGYKGKTQFKLYGNV